MKSVEAAVALRRVSVLEATVDTMTGENSSLKAALAGSAHAYFPRMGEPSTIWRRWHSD